MRQTYLMEGQLETRAEWGVTPYILEELLSRTMVRTLHAAYEG